MSEIAAEHSRFDLAMKQKKTICNCRGRNLKTMQEILADRFSNKQNLQMVR